MATQSYNIDYLTGDTGYDDKQFQTDYKELGVEIPDSLLYTKEMNKFVAQAERDRTIAMLPNEFNPRTKRKYTEEEATIEADAIYDKVTNSFEMLYEKLKL